MTFRRQKNFHDEEESFKKQKQWIREREVEEAHKNAFEKERREIVARKRDREREDFYRRLEEAQQKLIVAQNNLEKVLQKHQQEKKVTFKESSPTKVCDYFQITSLLHFLHDAKQVRFVNPDQSIHSLSLIIKK